MANGHQRLIPALRMLIGIVELERGFTGDFPFISWFKSVPWKV
jgi:hypothetical protein